MRLRRVFHPVLTRLHMVFKLIMHYRMHEVLQGLVAAMEGFFINMWSDMSMISNPACGRCLLAHKSTAKDDDSQLGTAYRESDQTNGCRSKPSIRFQSDFDCDKSLPPFAVVCSRQDVWISPANGRSRIPHS